jgi:hypothetical protein
MAIVQISRIKQRRGLQQDLPQLSSGELGWSIDSRRLYIGNGKLEEGAPIEGRTEILTEFSVLNFTNTLTANVEALQTNVSIMQGNITTINSTLAALATGTTSSNVAVLPAGTGEVVAYTANNATISYTLTQGTYQRTGVITSSRYNSTVSYTEDYNETGTTTTVFSVTGNSTHSSFAYNNPITTSSLLYKVISLT